jgi:ketosteroid isomerase-like protein
MKRTSKSKYLLIFGVTVLFIMPALRTSDTDKKPAGLEDTLLSVDKEFSDLSVSKGTAEAFLTYAADDVIVMRQDLLPITGITELKKHYENGVRKNTTLKWQPVKAEVAGSGELGYTFGKWEFIVKQQDGKDTSFYGVYVTVWKKQPNGSWKFVLDGGNSTPQF